MRIPQTYAYSASLFEQILITNTKMFLLQYQNCSFDDTIVHVTFEILYEYVVVMLQNWQSFPHVNISIFQNLKYF